MNLKDHQGASYIDCSMRLYMHEDIFARKQVMAAVRRKMISWV